MITGIIIALISTTLWFLFKKLFWKEKIPELHGKHVLVTGGSSGIGKSVAKEACRLGAHVTIIARDLSRLEAAAQEIAAHKINQRQHVNFIALDLSQNYQVIKQNLEEIEGKVGSIYVLVNCVGKAVCNKFEQAAETDFSEMLSVNYLSTVYPTQIVAKSMCLRKEGHIVVCGSQASLLGVFGMSAYCGSKFALRGYAETLYMELIPYNVSITLCLPPDTNTPGYELENLSKPEETKLISQSAGLYEPDEVARQLLVDTLKKRFFSTVGVESFLLTTLCSGMSPFSSPGETYLQVVFMSLFRFVGLFYHAYFRRLIIRCNSQTQKKKE